MTPVLELRGVGRSFGGLPVLDDVSLSVWPGEVLGLIGPNGAGKTTLFNVVTGFVPPGTGSVHLDGQVIDALSPARRARRGLVRTFQKPTAFAALTLRENLALATRQAGNVGLRWFGAQARRAEATRQADALLDTAGLARHRDRPLHTLGHGEQRLVDTLVALALRPRLLLLDEPTAGLSADEAANLLDLACQPGTVAATVLIAHDLDVVFARCHRVAVLAAGRLLCCDTPRAVLAHPGARAAYLGAVPPA